MAESGDVARMLEVAGQDPASIKALRETLQKVRDLAYSGRLEETAFVEELRAIVGPR